MIDLRTYSKGDYDAGPLWKRVLWYIVSRLFFETRIPWTSRLKAGILRVFGANAGPDFVIKPSVKIKYPWFLTIGESCWIGENVWIDNVAAVELGDHVVLSQGVVLVTGNHDYKSKSFDLRTEPIEIGSFAWIGAHSVVGPKTEIGEGAVLTVGSVALGHIEARSVYSGNPAKKVRDRIADE